MSHLALRRVVVRLLHDPLFADAIAADPARALAGVALTADERAWLVATPRAAWGTDPARPGRVLAALADEFPATLALVPERAASFFAGPAFHAAVQERGSLALAFADHLACEGGARVRAVARLERAIAALRRAGRAPNVPAGRLRLAPQVAVVRVPEGAPALLAALRAGGRGAPLGARDAPVLVIAPTGGETTIESLEPALAALLARAQAGCARVDLLAEARRLGAESGEDEEIVAGLVSDGLLVGAGDLRR